ncbi:U3 small nucleolar RNA-associated protein 18 [Tripterygium wilfordii]|uniref:U3 small nucleolar RNA-associated protein 18 n=1 Tax=Tripterygium wilfordii TaxID=458696 RepID=A0A7J7DCZ3_TRIWF|nr:U3 small nucleolar RNA-associated protein 18 [Tripterygium wilfordii]
MSLISQNAISRNRVKARREQADEPRFLEENKNNEDLRESELDIPTKKKRKKEKEGKLGVEQEQQMMKLENFLFGSLYSPIEFGKEKAQDEAEKGSALFYVDRSANDLSFDEEDAETDEESSDEGATEQRKAVWVDDEEEKTNVHIAKTNRLRKLMKEEDESLISGSEYVSRLRAQHVKLNPGTDWALPDSRVRDDSGYDDELSDEEDGAVAARGFEELEAFDDILRTNEDLVVKSNAKLLPGILEYSRLVDANAEDPSNCPINSVQFHRNAQLLLTAGLDRRLRFFQIDGKRNNEIQSIFLDDCPIRKASFVPDGSQVIVVGRRNFFYSFDLVQAKVDRIGPLVGREEKSLEVFEVSPDSSTIAFVGNEGYILLVSSKTKELIGTLKMNGTTRSLAFANNGLQLLSTGGDAGSDSGIVNIYNREEFLGGKRKPIKTIENLTTKVDFLRFNNDAQILAMCSNMKKNSMKLIHIPSCTVFSNWPGPNRLLHYPRCLDFSPGGGFMAVGNAAGKVLLYKLHHYHHA